MCPSSAQGIYPGRLQYMKARVCDHVESKEVRAKMELSGECSESIVSILVTNVISIIKSLL